MANLTLQGACPAPFLDNSLFPTTGGRIAGRLCSQITAETSCCLPCPSTDFIFPQSFVQVYRVAEGLNFLAIALSVFLLLTFAVLPVEKTRRHYLSVCLIIALILESLGFIVGVVVKPNQCFNEITPNDMFSSLTCAWTGALLISGGIAITVWIFMRALSMHLQVCWDISPGRKFFYGAQAGGWGVVAVLFTLTTAFTGYSFRFGDTCHVNSKNSIQVFWGPLLTIAGLSALVQAATFIYCINIYLKNIWSDEKTETNSTGLPSYTTSIRTQSAKAVWRRVRKVIWLQWRSMLIVVFILVDIVFLAVTFIVMDHVITSVTVDHNISRVEPWLFCLIANGKATDQCFKLGQEAIVNQATVVAILVLLALAGVEHFILVCRWSMFTGWAEWFRGVFRRNGDFVSLDARRFSGDPRTIELLRVSTAVDPSAAKAAIASPTETVTTASFGDRGSEFFGSKEAAIERTVEVSRTYSSPPTSFSRPRTPSQTFSAERPPNVRSREWDPMTTYARGGLGLNPPYE